MVIIPSWQSAQWMCTTAHRLENAAIQRDEPNQAATYWILELCVHLCDYFSHLLELGEHIFLWYSAAEHRLHLPNQFAILSTRKVVEHRGNERTPEAAEVVVDVNSTL